MATNAANISLFDLQNEVSTHIDWQPRYRWTTVEEICKRTLSGKAIENSYHDKLAEF